MSGSDERANERDAGAAGRRPTAPASRGSRKERAPTGSLSSAAGLTAVGRYEDSLALLERFRSDGDAHALNALITRYYDRVRRIARIRMGSRLRRLTESDDLVQETFAVAFRKLGELDLRDHSSLIQYLSRVLEHQIRDAVDYFGAQKRNPASGALLSTDRDDAEGAALAAPSPTPGPVEQAASRELGELYDSCVQSLDPLHREVILLREYANASWAEIRAALDRPSEHAARLVYSRAQIKLAERLRRRLGR